ncbi:hypothetical protein EON65_43265 [archaeon]|nr:MAG: hypothetical protein EON65_43265 [archaeon]
MEVALILLILIYILDLPSAFAGVGCTFLFIPLMTYLAQFFAYYRGLTAQATDTRIRYIGEVIEGIMPVKAYTWEKSFFLYISSLRLNEMIYISKSQFLRSINQALMFCTPAIISFVTFVVYWALGGVLTVPKVG